MTDFCPPKNYRRLGEIRLTAALVEQMETTGVLAATLRREAQAGALRALDGSDATVFIGGSGQITGFQLNDHVDHETYREIDFDIGTLCLTWVGDSIRIKLRTD